MNCRECLAVDCSPSPTVDCASPYGELLPVPHGDCSSFATVNCRSPTVNCAQCLWHGVAARCPAARWFVPNQLWTASVIRMFTDHPDEGMPLFLHCTGSGPKQCSPMLAHQMLVSCIRRNVRGGGGECALVLCSEPKAAEMGAACNGHCHHAVSQNCPLWAIARKTRVIVQEVLSCGKGITAETSCFVSLLALTSWHPEDFAASLWFAGFEETSHALCERSSQCLLQSFWRARARCTPLRSSSEIDWDSRLCNKGTWFRPVLFCE